jgi:A/G-specific adenine glycosylase
MEDIFHNSQKNLLKKIKSPLLLWYQAQARILPWREQTTPYRVWISEIMLQQTRVTAVLPYYERFINAIPDVAALASCPDDTLMKLWQGLGYYNRARNLKKAAKIIMQKYNGNIPMDFTSLLKLPGIGRYTAAAISSIAGQHPAPAVDGNVLRVISRFMFLQADITLDKTKRAVEQALLPLYEEGPVSSSLNQALMELGAVICVPHGIPHCNQCPLNSLCLAKQKGCQLALPIKKRKASRCREALTILVVHNQKNQIAIRKRPAKGLLAGLYELPNISGHLTRREIKTFFSHHHIPVNRITSLPPAHHIFTHIEWYMIGFDIQLIANDAERLLTNEAFRSSFWASKEELASKYSIPTAFQYFLPTNSEKT